MNRREFLQAGLAAGALASAPIGPSLRAQARAVTLVVDPSDPVATSAPAAWALSFLEGRLTAARVTVRRSATVRQAPAGDLCLVVAGAMTTMAAAAVKAAGRQMSAGPERLAILPSKVANRDTLVVAGSDPRGLVYGLLDIADRVTHGQPVAAVFAPPAAVIETPAVPVRSVMRQFTSETLDTPWLFDRDFWPPYLTMLAGHRFNRLHLGFGLGYDTLSGVIDSYLLFLYPFLVDVPGYNVRLTNWTNEQRARALDTLRYISEETVRRGLDFELGIWMHGFRLPNSPRARYVVEGLTDENHAAYCRDALAAVLKACPAISSVGLRIHGESGVAEGSYEFWKTVFDGVPRSGRRVEIDLHAKGIDQTMIDHALATGLPVNVSPKYWAEHLGMPYHQASIRDIEMPVEGRTGRGLMTISEGQRSFTRYGYADLLRDDRQYSVRHRVFAGTQRLLASGDPEWAAAYARILTFAGSTGVDVMEPLTCRGRRGTGEIGGRRTGYVDASLEPRWDWEKYAYWYRVWGRLLYDPATEAAVWQRHLGAGPRARALEAALASASRVLPIVTTAYLPSAACDAYWPELYWNQPIAAPPQPNPYGDSPQPRVFQHASPLDPQLFSSMTEHARGLLGGPPSGKYSPIEVAGWLEDLAADARRSLTTAGQPASVEERRLAIDIEIQIGLARFFASKFRAGVLAAIHDQTQDRAALEASIAAYRGARAEWAALAARATGVYATELAASDKISNRGHWADRLPAIDADIAALVQRAAAARPAAEPNVARAITAALGRPARPAPAIRHTPPTTFTPGAALVLDVSPTPMASAAPVLGRLFFRHVNQAERFENAPLAAAPDGVLRGTIPAAYTNSPYPLQYFFEFTQAGQAWISPGFTRSLTGLPYHVVMAAGRASVPPSR